MVNEDILTALKNAVERGESLETAKEIMITSGYNEKEIEEALKFVSETQKILEAKPDEKLIMPEKRGLFSSIFGKKTKTGEEAKKIQPLQTTISEKKTTEQIKEEISEKSSADSGKILSKESGQTEVKKTSHLKEIILVGVLLILVGLFITTMFFNDSIIKFLS